MALYVYNTSKSEKPSFQHDKFLGTRLNTCNTDSQRGFKLLNSCNRMYFEVDPKILYGDDKISGIMHYGEFVTFECVFPDLKSLIFYFKNTSHQKIFNTSHIF